MRVCNDCKVASTNFSNGSYYCKPCNAKRQSIWREINQKILRRYKTMKGCVFCGYRSHHSALQFDHINPRHKTGQDKIRTPSMLRKQWDNIQVVCANCHSHKTFLEGSNQLGGNPNERS